MDEHEAWLLGESGARDPASRGLLGFIASNVTDAGGVLDEETFAKAMRTAMDAPWKPMPPIVSMATIRSAQESHHNCSGRAHEASWEYVRTPRWRWLKRHRALREYHEAMTVAEILHKTFGSHFT